MVGQLLEHLGLHFVEFGGITASCRETTNFTDDPRSNDVLPKVAEIHRLLAELLLESVKFAQTESFRQETETGRLTNGTVAEFAEGPENNLAMVERPTSRGELLDRDPRS